MSLSARPLRRLIGVNAYDSGATDARARLDRQQCPSPVTRQVGWFERIGIKPSDVGCAQVAVNLK